MNELITLVAQRTGLSQEDAQKAVEVIIDVLEQRLPGPIASHLDSFLAGGASAIGGEASSAAGEMLKGAIGSFFQKKQRRKQHQAVLTQTRNTSATLQACAIHPPA